MSAPEPMKLESGKTVRAYILADVWLDIKHEGWTLTITGSRGVRVSLNKEFQGVEINGEEIKVRDGELREGDYP